MVVVDAVVVEVVSVVVDPSAVVVVVPVVVVSPAAVDVEADVDVESHEAAQTLLQQLSPVSQRPILMASL